MDTIQSLKYKSTPLEEEEMWKSELEREGFTVIRAVAGEEEVDKARFWSGSGLRVSGLGSRGKSRTRGQMRRGLTGPG